MVGEPMETADGNMSMASTLCVVSNISLSVLPYGQNTTDYGNHEDAVQNFMQNNFSADYY
jgi:hypothetical protein